MKIRIKKVPNNQNARKWHHKHPDGGGLTLKQNVRVRNNNSPTRELSEVIEDQMRIKISGPNPQYLIPYMPSKSIVINNSTTSTNVLDTLAKYAGIHNRDIKPSQNPIKRNPKPKYVDPWEVIGLASQETNFGAQPRTFINGDKQEQRAYYNANQLTAYGDVPSWALMNDYHWLDTDRTEHPILDAIRYYSQGDYNRGDKNHTSDVKKRGNSIKNNKDVQKWWNESGKYIYNNEPTLEQLFWVEHAKTDPLNYLNGIFRYDKFGNPITIH